MTSFYRDDLAALPEMELAAKVVYEMSGLGPKDIDATCLYDAFTPEVLMQIEAFGFCGKGEAKDFVTEDSLTLGGALPNNTHGGLLSEAYIHGVNNLAEGARLIRGTSSNMSRCGILARNHLLFRPCRFGPREADHLFEEFPHDLRNSTHDQ